MILIDKPYVSEFLIKTIKENKFPIVSTSVAKEMIPDECLNWITEEEARNKIINDPNTLIYTNSENSISWIENNFSTSSVPKQIKAFKNKIEFRELIIDTFPNYFYKAVKYEELKNINLDDIQFPFIIKPAVGFFSIAVYLVQSLEEWKPIVDKIENEIANLNGLYPKEVIGVTDFILEEYIEGEEYAIDSYYDDKGDPVILNILHHKFSSKDDVSDRVYSTSKEIIEKHEVAIKKFLSIIGNKINLKNFPVHVEVRIDSDGNLSPIEINPLRFGGWCTTGDLSWFAFGFNSYEYYLKSNKPNWKEIFKTRQNKKYSIIVLDNNSGIKENEIESFDYDKLLKEFKKPMSLRKVDYKKYSVFGFLFIETTCGEEEELNQILSSKLRKYITIKES